MNIKILLIAGVLSVAAACSKSPDPVPTPIGGKGGNGTLRVTPRHHGNQIDSCMIYIKYNAVDPPANNQYDDSVKCVKVAGVPVATFTSLKKGNYYLYGYGWDPTLTPPDHVKGAYAFLLSTETDQSIDLAISEN